MNLVYNIFKMINMLTVIASSYSKVINKIIDIDKIQPIKGYKFIDGPHNTVLIRPKANSFIKTIRYSKYNGIKRHKRDTKEYQFDDTDINHDSNDLKKLAGKWLQIRPVLVTIRKEILDSIQQLDNSDEQIQNFIEKGRDLCEQTTLLKNKTDTNDKLRIRSFASAKKQFQKFKKNIFDLENKSNSEEIKAMTYDIPAYIKAHPDVIITAGGTRENDFRNDQVLKIVSPVFAADSFSPSSHGHSSPGRTSRWIAHVSAATDPDLEYIDTLLNRILKVRIKRSNSGHENVHGLQKKVLTLQADNKISNSYQPLKNIDSVSKKKQHKRTKLSKTNSDVKYFAGLLKKDINRLQDKHSISETKQQFDGLIKKMVKRLSRQSNSGLHPDLPLDPSLVHSGTFSVASLAKHQNDKDFHSKLLARNTNRDKTWKKWKRSVDDSKLNDIKHDRDVLAHLNFRSTKLHRGNNVRSEPPSTDNLRALLEKDRHLMTPHDVVMDKLLSEIHNSKHSLKTIDVDDMNSDLKSAQDEIGTDIKTLEDMQIHDFEHLRKRFLKKQKQVDKNLNQIKKDRVKLYEAEKKQEKSATLLTKEEKKNLSERKMEIQYNNLIAKVLEGFV